MKKSQSILKLFSAQTMTDSDIDMKLPAQVIDMKFPFQSTINN